MKRFFALLAALCLLLSILPAGAERYPTLTVTPLSGYTLRESTEEIRVFAAMSMKANIVGYIIPGGQQTVQLLGIDGEWGYVSFTSISGVSYGYIPLSCFEKAPEATTTPAPAPSYDAGSSAWILNSAEGFRLNLRGEPAATAKSLGKYYTGTPVTLTGNTENGYVQVLLAGSVLGWLDTRFLTTDAASLVPETPMVTIKNSGSGATLRSGPGTTYDRLGYYPHGTLVTVLGVRSDGWYHVVVDGQIGYLAEGLLSGTFPYAYGTDSDNPALDDPTADVVSVHYINMRSASGQLHLRKAASSSSKSLGLFYTGTPLTVISYTRTGWAYVRIGHVEGYLDADYLTAMTPTQYGDSRVVRNSRATGLNLRSMPSTGGELLAFAPNYSAVTVLGELSDGWCYVDYNGTLGYMLGTSLKKSN